MRNLYLLLIAIGLTVSASAQRMYFIYFQTENSSPFYVRMGDKTYSSSSSGYLILSELKDSSYDLFVGFPSSRAESKFNVTVAGKDLGLSIKTNEDGTISLTDLQTMAVINPKIDESQKNITYQSRNDNFTSLLSKAADDSSILYVPVVKQDIVKKEEPKKEEVKIKTEDSVVKTDTVATKPQTDVAVTETKTTDSTLTQVQNNPAQNNVATEIQKTDTVAVTTSQPEQKNSSADSLIAKQPEKINQQTTDTVATVIQQPVEYKRSLVKKHSESSTSEGFGLVYYDTYENGADTIRLIIPNPKIAFKQPDTTNVQDQTQMLDVKKDTLLQKVIADNKPPVKSNCSATATDNDFFKLRKNMAAKVTDEEMVSEAKRYFRNKCFSTQQIRNLSTLFLTSAGKYEFFDAAYTHVTDQEQFATLQSELKDDYYIKRFKALIGE